MEEVDQFGNVIAGDSTSTVTVARGSVGTANLQGSNVTVTLVDGVATFSGLFYDKAETMDLSFSSSSSAVSGATSGNILVSPAPTAQLVIQTEPSPTATAGAALQTQPVIYEKDQFNNLETGDNSTVVSAMQNTGAGPLQGTINATVSGGVARFANLGDTRAETTTLEFVSGTLFSASPSTSIVVTPAIASKLAIQTQPSTTATARSSVRGSAGGLSRRFQWQPRDIQQHRVRDGFARERQRHASGKQVGDRRGRNRDVCRPRRHQGRNHLAHVLKAASLTAGPTTSITVNPAAPYQLLINNQPSSTATAGQPFAIQPTIDEVDQYGNLETTDNSTAINATLASGNGPLVGTTSETVAGGVASFVSLADNRAGVISLNFAAAGLTAGPSNNIFISPASAADLVIQTAPYALVTAGNLLTDPIVINEVDQYGNIETSDNSTVVTASMHSGLGSTHRHEDCHRRCRSRVVRQPRKRHSRTARTPVLRGQPIPSDLSPEHRRAGSRDQAGRHPAAERRHRGRRVRNHS